MSFTDVDVAIRSECHHHRLPQETLALAFVPVTPASRRAEGRQQLPIRTDLHHRRSIGGGNPDVVLGIDGHAMRLVLVTDNVSADLTNQLVVGIELEQLRLPCVCSLKSPEVAFRVERYRRNSARPRRQHIRIRECVSHRLLPLNSLQCLTTPSQTISTERRTAARWRLCSKQGRCCGSHRLGAARKNSDIPGGVHRRSPGRIGKRSLEKPRGRSIDCRPLGCRMRLGEYSRSAQHHAEDDRDTGSEDPSLQRHLSYAVAIRLPPSTVPAGKNRCFPMIVPL